MPDVSATAVPEKKSDSPIKWGPVAAVVVTIVIYFLAQLLGGFLVVAVGKTKGLSRPQLEDWLNGTVPQFFFVLLTEGATLGLLWWFLRRVKVTFKTLGLRRPRTRDLTSALLGLAVYFPLLIAAMAAVKAWVPGINLDQQQQIGFTGAHGVALVLVFISLVLLPPLAEEILTRGFLYLGLKTRLPVIWAAIVTSLLFASAHLQFGSGAPLLWSAAVDTFILSMVLVWLRERTDGLWASIGVHMTKNAIAFLALFIFVK